MVVVSFYLASILAFTPVFGGNPIIETASDLNMNEHLSSLAQTSGEIKEITVKQVFSYPTFEVHGETVAVRVYETNFNMVRAGYPVIPASILTFELPFGSIIQDISVDHSDPETIPLSGTLPIGRYNYDTLFSNERSLNDVVSLDEIYPEDWVTSHTGGGLSGKEHTTFLTIRMYPVRYDGSMHELLFVQTINITVTYEEPTTPLIQDNDVYDLLIIAPEKFLSDLEPLVIHKNNNGVKTKLVSTATVYDEMFWNGRDEQEKIKYFIKNAIETWGIRHVLLVGGLDGQTDQWSLPVRYSHVVPPDEQEYAEQSFLSDLYYADIYDGIGGFSSWDSNDDDQFAVWNEVYKDEMDLYSDVFLGRLSCRSSQEVSIMVDKIITYETNTDTDEWFYNYVIVAGDSYPDETGFNEGELIGERSVEIMPDFTPLRVYSSIDDINRKTVNDAMNPGAGFAYFCGHGSPGSWSTHFPPDGLEWTTGYNLPDMIPLHNQEKLPITVVGGCHNGQFDVGLTNMLKGIKEYGIMGYFFTQPFRFYYNEWVPNCWAWWLTSKSNGGAIATIANTGLGTHGEGDQDYNEIADYLEVLDGWLELRFLELYGELDQDDLGLNHAQAMTEYLHVFLGSNEKMDTKMVQQWELFGDPSLKIGGYFK